MQAIFWMCGTLTSFCLLAVGIRELSENVPVFQTLFIRSVIGLMLITAILKATRQLDSIRTNRIAMHAFRAVFHFGGQYGWFIGIGLLPLAEVFALEFTVPIWTLLIAAVFLGEKVTARKVAAIVLGLLGVLIIVRPGVEIVDPASLIVLAAAICYAVSHSATKALTSTEAPLIILFYMCLMQMPIAFIFSLQGWTMPVGTQWLWLAVISLTGLSAHYCLTRAMQFAEVTTIVTIDFLRLPLIALVGVLLYQERFEIWVLLGGALMLFANLLNIKPNLNRSGPTAAAK